MWFITPEIEVEVTTKKAGNELVVPKPLIAMKANDKPIQEIRVVAEKRFLWRGKGVQLASLTKLMNPEDEKEVASSEVLEILERYTYKFIDALGNEVGKEDIRYFAVQPDGTEAEVRPFERTNEIRIPEENWIPSTTIDEFEISNVYELYSTKEEVIRKLYEEAEKRLKQDQIGITTFSFGGFVSYYAFLVPYLKIDKNEGSNKESPKFGWLLKLSDRKTQCNYMQDIPAKVKIPIREVPTLQTLPPIQALIVTTKKKKKTDQP